MPKTERVPDTRSERTVRPAYGRMYGVGATLVALAVFAVFASWILLDPDSLRHASREDGWVENLSAVFWGLSAAGFIIAGIRSSFLRRRPERWRYVCIACYALAMIFFCGEEVSWGQRMIGVDTPSWLGAMNRQNEITIHNIGPLQYWQDRFFLLFIAAVAVLFPAIAAFDRGRKLLQKLALPVLPPAYIGFFILGYIYIKAFHAYDAGSDQSGEVRELFVSVGMLLFGLHGAIRPNDLFRHKEGQYKEGQ